MFYAIDQKPGILPQPAPLERGLAFSAAGKPAFTAVCRCKGAPIIPLPMTCNGVFGASFDVAFRSYLDPLQSGLTTLNMTIFEKVGYILQVRFRVEYVAIRLPEIDEMGNRISQIINFLFRYEMLPVHIFDIAVTAKTDIDPVFHRPGSNLRQIIQIILHDDRI